jgi:hypothetical protein
MSWLFSRVLVEKYWGTTMANAATKVRDLFQLTQRPMTLTEIRKAQPDLKASQISMALCYFMKQRYMTREQIKNEMSRGRKNVYVYTFYNDKQPVS